MRRIVTGGERSFFDPFDMVSFKTALSALFPFAKFEVA